jgi:hypothetical protein
MKYKKYFTAEEQKQICEYLRNDLKGVKLPYRKTCNLYQYLKLTKQIVLINSDNGIYKNISGDKINLKRLSVIKCAERFMDGRGLFSEHFNRAGHKRNKWFNEKELKNPAWLKHCVVSGIGASGHPTETSAGNFDIHYKNSNMKNFECYFMFSQAHRYTFGTLKAYLYLRNKGVPVCYSGAKEALKQLM